MLLSLCILVLHTVVPHNHHEELAPEIHIQEHESADSIFDFIQLAFHFNPSENHLEDYHKPNIEYQVYAFFEQQAVSEFHGYHFEQRNNKFYVNPFLTGKSIPISTLDFRGPPS